MEKPPKWPVKAKVVRPLTTFSNKIILVASAMAGMLVRNPQVSLEELASEACWGSSMLDTHQHHTICDASTLASANATDVVCRRRPLRLPRLKGKGKGKGLEQQWQM